MKSLSLIVPCVLGACSLSPLPEEPPPLRSMDEPLALKQEPDDESARQALARGCFSGLRLKTAWFDDPLEPGQTPDALEITQIIENSPAQAASLRVGDLLLSVRTGDTPAQELRWPSQWNKLEADAKPGAALKLRLDRAGTEFSATLVLAARVNPARRTGAERFREEQRAGIVIRTATQVEASTTGLGTGGGAVLVGMSANSPFRRAGLQFRDLITSVQGRPVHHPQVLLAAIRNADKGSSLKIGFFRGGSSSVTNAEVSLSRRGRGITNLDIPLLFRYSSARDRTQMSILFGFIGYESTPAAAQYTLLWVVSWRTGDRDRLLEVGK